MLLYEGVKHQDSNESLLVVQFIFPQYPVQMTCSGIHTSYHGELGYTASQRFMGDSVGRGGATDGGDEVRAMYIGHCKAIVAQWLDLRLLL